MRSLLSLHRRTAAARPSCPLNVAHRGASALAAENTLAALRRAIVLGADLVEVDVQRTRDGALVLMHDATLTRTTDVRRVHPDRAPWRVADFTYDELVRLDAGRWRSPEDAGEPVPTLAEAIGLVRRSGSGLLVELKSPGHHPGIVSDLVAVLRAAPGYLDEAVSGRRLVVQSFDVAAMKDHKTRLPEVPVGILGAPAAANLPALASWAQQVNPRLVGTSERYVEQVHEAGMQCMVWTVNQRPAMRRALRLGVDGVITNKPDVLAELLGREGSGQRPGQRPRAGNDVSAGAAWVEAQAR